MEFLTSNVQVWHLAVVVAVLVVAFVIYDNMPLKDSAELVTKCELRRELDSYVTSYSFTVHKEFQSQDYRHIGKRLAALEQSWFKRKVAEWIGLE